MTTSKMLICPYCGETQAAGERCKACGGLFEPLSRQATHNAMGPWFVRNPDRPFQPGCSYETIVKMIDREQVTKYSILRGPTTKQFWTVARRVPGIAHLLGYCHSCDAPVDPDDHGCHACGVSFGAYLDRNFLGLPEVRPLPWEAPVEDDLAREEARPREYEMAPRPPATGLSSFATDEELLGGAGAAARPHPMPRPGATGSPGPVSAAGSAPGAVATVTPSPSDRSGSGGYSSGAALLSMRRKVEAQARSIRLLVVMLVVALMVTLVVTAVAIMRTPPGPAGVPSGPPGATPTAPTVNEQTPPSPDVASQAEAGGALGTGPEASMEDDPGPIAPPPGAPEIEEVDPIALPPAAAMARALEIAGAAGDRAKPRAERLASLDEALRILRHVAANATESDRPADLAATIERLEQQRERVALEEFFP